MIEIKDMKFNVFRIYTSNVLEEETNDPIELMELNALAHKYGLKVNKLSNICARNIKCLLFDLKCCPSCLLKRAKELKLKKIIITIKRHMIKNVEALVDAE